MKILIGIAVVCIFIGVLLWLCLKKQVEGKADLTKKIQRIGFVMFITALIVNIVYLLVVPFMVKGFVPNLLYALQVAGFITLYPFIVLATFVGLARWKSNKKQGESQK